MPRARLGLGRSRDNRGCRDPKKLQTSRTIRNNRAYEKAIELVKRKSYVQFSEVRAPKYLIEQAKRYAEGIQQGHYIDLERRSENRDAKPVLEAIEQLEKIVNDTK